MRNCTTAMKSLRSDTAKDAINTLNDKTKYCKDPAITGEKSLANDDTQVCKI